MRCFGRKFLIWLSLMFLFILVGRLLVNRGFYLPILIISTSDILIPKSYSSSQQDVQTGAFAFAAGMYMAGLQPRNRSFCRWYHGLPNMLSYPASKVSWSPEIGEKSPYRVLPFILRGTEERNKLPQVTLCTHATADQVYGIVELARRWEGPLSLAVFTPGLDANIAVALLDRACRCEPEMYKVSVHLVFPAGRPPALEQIIQVQVTDIELLPSQKLASGFMEIVRERPPKSGIIFVVPVFEIESNELPPLTKKELLLATKAGLAVYFHRFLCSHCQRFPGLARWLIRPDPGKVKPLIITKREYPYHRWEPVFIGTQNDPFYAEEMSWEGRQDKMSQMFEMCLLNYRLIILDGAFLVHTPGIKRKTAKINAAKQAFLKPHERRNARIYQRIIRRLLKQYPTNRKCAH
ncbi:beta-1,4-glucuronyltransferase 1-like isoform X4 [Frieseomelitta varia]|uniref:beta-1,4-glucuronyltransferase 1-like isoform X4 n=1 Tax=Frieseomelitta varia TaxID=561572 RepID=UPI001CB68F18|nr:beta-1,4-glucuronyltransferase 1-like isoform X4 [Frieseomelitta varia]